MALKARLELRQQQRLSLTATVRTRLSVLRMAAADLDEDIAREAARNPFLLVDWPAPRATAPLAPDLPAVAAPEGFQQALLRQIAAMDLPPAQADLAALVVGELREDGYLDSDLGALADELGQPRAALVAALETVQSCDPPGVGARTVAECLALQLMARGLARAEARATIAHLPLLARRDWAAAGAALGLPPDELRARAALLRGLTPRPLPDAPRPEPQSLRADLRVERGRDAALSISVETGHRPVLRLDPGLVRRAASDGFAPDLLEAARALIDAVELRTTTLRALADWLLREQRGFFDRGLAGLRPATRSEAARDLGVHPSTVSRAVAAKAIEVDGRLWPLSVFFASGVAGAGGAISARAVGHRIAAMIVDEDAARPISDQKIAQKLHDEGVDIARRTVAKYRQGLRIPSSSQRRRLAAARRGW